MRPGRRRTLRSVAGERVLASCSSAEGVVLAGTRDALHLGDERLPWEEVQAADWDRDREVLRVVETGRWGEERREHAFAVTEPGLLLQLVRERVTASIVLQRHVPVDGSRGVRVIGRRPPRGNAAIAWFFEYDEGVDPLDPRVHEAATAALATARADVGE